MEQLPIDAILDDLKGQLRQHRAVVLQAPPGAGKTTRVPVSLLAETWLGQKSILMLQPRRMAARHAAAFMSAQLKEPVGQTVGYSVRFDSKRGKTTRIEVVTEGILTRRLQADPELNGIGLVIFDEFHERSIHSDLALALCCDMQAALRDDLKILVMSATLDAKPLATLLKNCPILTSEGRSHPVITHYLPQGPNSHIADSVANGIIMALQRNEGDILAFLPGAREIRLCAQKLDQLTDATICQLYGALPFKTQQQALTPGTRRRVILATNIAETSLTIEGISTVIDSGWERRPRYDVRTGISRLELKRISAASAEQRRGRAGRLGPGTCYRLWSQGQQAELLPQTPPEIRTSDLTSLLLELANWGENDPSRLIWLDPPSPSLVNAGKKLLRWMGAIDNQGRITPLGQRMVRLSLPPRLARLVVAADDDNLGPLGCELAALLSERDRLPYTFAQTTSSCDLEIHWSFFQKNSTSPGVETVQRIIDDLKKSLHVRESTAWPQNQQRVKLWLAVAYPDRIAKQREPGSRRYMLSDGSGATLSNRSSLQTPPFLIALELQDRQGEKEITLASSINLELITQTFEQYIEEQRLVHWDQGSGCLFARKVTRFGALHLTEKPIKADPYEQTETVLAEIRRIGLNQMNWSSNARQFAARVRLCQQHVPELKWPDFSITGLEEKMTHWLSPFLSGISARSALLQLDLFQPLQAYLPWELQQHLERLVPERIAVPSGSCVRIDYTNGESPLLAVKLQELFGLEHNPEITNGKVALAIHMLSPAGRLLAITQDLPYFWDNVYPEIRKEMQGRYPKHPWPEDPWNARASSKTKSRKDC